MLGSRILTSQTVLRASLSEARILDNLNRVRRISNRGLAERVGFEPTVEFPLHTLSKRAP